GAVPPRVRGGVHRAAGSRGFLRHRIAPAHAGRRLPVALVSEARGRAASLPHADREDATVLDGYAGAVNIRHPPARLGSMAAIRSISVIATLVSWSARPAAIAAC